MRIVAPDYYPEFSCIMDRCRHTCCAGWEIDIDEETLDKYRKLPGALGEKLRREIENGSFRLQGEAERCPFLQENGLCELIVSLGEQALCQICRDHPRFRNYWPDRIEIGLGMACEEACRIILTKTEPVKLIDIGEEPDAEARHAEDPEDEKEAPCGGGAQSPAEDNEASCSDGAGEAEDGFFEEVNELFDLRDTLTSILQDRSFPVDDRVQRMLEYCGLSSAVMTEGRNEDTGNRGDAAEDDVERDYAKEEHVKEDRLVRESLETMGEQLLVYLLYRHLADALYDGRTEDRLLFVAESYGKLRKQWTEKLIELRRMPGRSMCGRGTLTPEETDALILIARQFSEDVEYDTDTWGLED